jgi:hypothetical protein
MIFSASELRAITKTAIKKESLFLEKKKNKLIKKIMFKISFSCFCLANSGKHQGNLYVESIDKLTKNGDVTNDLLTEILENLSNLGFRVLEEEPKKYNISWYGL